MNYIIDPKLVYWISVASAVKIFIIAIAAIILTVCIVIFILINTDCYYYKDEDLVAKLKKVFKITAVCISSIFISLFIPSKETSIEMIISSKVTTESVQTTKEEIYDIIDYTVEKIYGNNNDK